MGGERTSSIMARARQAALARKDNPALRFLYKARQLSRSPAAARANPRESLRFLLHSSEVSNFTYENSNVEEMIAAVAAVAEADPAEVERLNAELDADEELRSRLAAGLAGRADRGDAPLYGYRRISYCLIRLRKPAAVVECGTHDGLGSSVILRALERNAAEGSPGGLRSCDLSPGAGWLIPDSLRANFELFVGDAAEALPRMLSGGVDYFVEDFGYAFAGKREFIDAAVAEAGEDGVLVLTEVDETPVLAERARQASGSFAVFREQPLDHWWAGHDWGIAALPGPG